MSEITGASEWGSAGTSGVSALFTHEAEAAVLAKERKRAYYADYTRRKREAEKQAARDVEAAAAALAAERETNARLQNEQTAICSMVLYQQEAVQLLYDAHKEQQRGGQEATATAAGGKRTAATVGGAGEPAAGTGEAREPAAAGEQQQQQQQQQEASEQQQHESQQQQQQPLPSPGSGGWGQPIETQGAAASVPYAMALVQQYCLNPTLRFISRVHKRCVRAGRARRSCGATAAAGGCPCRPPPASHRHPPTTAAPPLPLPNAAAGWPCRCCPRTCSSSAMSPSWPTWRPA